jgi:hypothetical protein
MTNAILPDGPMCLETASCAEMAAPSFTPTGDDSMGINGVLFHLCFFTLDVNDIRSGTTLEDAMAATVPMKTAEADRRVKRIIDWLGAISMSRRPVLLAS